MVPGKHTITQIYREALILAKIQKFDVFNCLDIMNNAEMLEELKFGSGDGTLHYYLYNYWVNDLKPTDLGIVLV